MKRGGILHRGHARHSGETVDFPIGHLLRIAWLASALLGSLGATSVTRATAQRRLSLHKGVRWYYRNIRKTRLANLQYNRPSSADRYTNDAAYFF